MGIKRYIVMFIASMMLVSTPAFADSISITPTETEVFKKLFEDVEKEVDSGSPGDYKIEVATKDNDKNGKNRVAILEYSDIDKQLKFNQDNFKQANKRKAEEVMKTFINALKDSTMPLDVQQEIMTSIQESDPDVAAFMIPLIFDESKADLFTAYKWLYPFLKVLRVVFGIGSILLILLLIGSTIMDMVYIGLPVWREAQAEKGKGSQNPFGVSYDALRTVKEIETDAVDGGYRNPYVLYLKRRSLTYIILAICLLYLIVGELGGVVSWVLSLASGVVG